MVDEVLRPGEVGVAPGRDAELPAHVVVLAEPVGVVGGRVCEDVVGAEVRMEVAAEGVGMLGAEVGAAVDLANGGGEGITGDLFLGAIHSNQF